MRAELQKKLIDRWPTWFDIGGDTRHTMMSFGFELGDGWFDLVWRLCEGLEPIVAATEKKRARQFKVLQVKEKLGGLRFYTNSENKAIFKLIETAKAESSLTCEVCGLPGKHRGGSRMQTVCDAHACVQ